VRQRIKVGYEPGRGGINCEFFCTTKPKGCNTIMVNVLEQLTKSSTRTTHIDDPPLSIGSPVHFHLTDLICDYEDRYILLLYCIMYKINDGL